MNLSPSQATTLPVCQTAAGAYAPLQKGVQHQPAAATQATISAAARTDNGIHVCTGLSATIACAGTAQTPIHVNLRDGATGAGTIIQSWVLSAPVNACTGIFLSDLCLPGSVNTAMTLEFEGAGVAASFEDVSLTYIDLIP